jgi:hypothetical protein
MMGEDGRTAIAEAIVDIDRAMSHLSPAEQEKLMRRRLALVEVLRADTIRRWERPETQSQSDHVVGKATRAD